MREIAKPVRIETSSTCSRSPLAKAPKKVSGMMASRCLTMPFFLGLLHIVRTALASSVAGSMLKPLPGCSTLPTIRPISSASGRNDLEVDQRLEADAPDLLEVAHRGDAVHHRAEDHRRDHHLDQRNEAVAERLQRSAGVGKEMSDQDADGDGDQHLDVEDRIPGLVVREERTMLRPLHDCVCHHDLHTSHAASFIQPAGGKPATRQSVPRRCLLLPMLS